MSDQFLIVGGPRRRGRPPRAGVTSTTQVNFRLTPEERAALGDVAKAEHRPLVAVIRDAIDAYVGDFSERVVFTPSGDRFKTSVKQ